MRPATRPREQRSDVRLLVVDPEAGPTLDATAPRVAERQAPELPSFLQPGDLLIVNDAATLPASLRGLGPRGEEVELRLLGTTAGERFRAVLFGAGDWRSPTEHRPPPPLLAPGERIRFGESLSAQVVAVSPISPRLVEIELDARGAALWMALYRYGRPVQYSYLRDELELWSVQTVYASRPWAAEMPSAGRPLSWQILLALRRRGVEIAWLTHAAGLSSTGDADLDRALPLAERYELPATTVAAIARAKKSGRRVIAVGTTVVRALEGAALNAVRSGAPRGTLLAGSGETELLLDATTTLHVVDGLLTGMHAPTESHFRLLSAFAAEPLLRAAWQTASDAGYECHEFGDLCLILRGSLATPDRKAG